MDILRKGGVVLQCNFHRHIVLLRFYMDGILNEFFPVGIQKGDKFLESFLRIELIMTKTVAVAVFILMAVPILNAVSVLLFLPQVFNIQMNALVQKGQFPES